MVSPTPVGWGKEASVATCDYQSFGSKKTVDVLGFFQGTYSMEKSFPVAQGSEIFELSFSLVRSQWLPFHDFMMIEMTVEGGSS